MEQLSISTRYIKSMLRFAEYRECDIDELLVRVGTSKLLLEKQGYVSVIFYGELYHAIIDSLQDEWFGLLQGGNVRRGSMRFLMRALVHCKNLEDAIERSADFFEICHGYIVKQEIVYDGDDVILKLVKLEHVLQSEFNVILKAAPNDIIKSTLLALHGINSWLTGVSIPIKEIFYQFSELEDNSANPEVKVSHGKSFNGYRISAECLSYPVVQQESSVEAFIRRAPYFVFLHSKKEGLIQQVKSVLAKSLGGVFPTADQMAEMLNMSTQTFFRHLKAQGVSYVQLKNSIRAEMAVHYLTSGELTNEHVSELLGFENPSTFYRVFKKWTGYSPGEYRKKFR